MKVIEVRDQVSLPLRRCFQLCVHGIQYRLFRSSITVGIVSLAVAFLMMMLSTSYIDRQVGADVYRRTADRRLLEEWVEKLGVPMTGERLGRKVAAVGIGSLAWQELRRWGGLTEQELSRLRSVALRQAEYQGYLGKRQRSALVGDRQGQDALAFLSDRQRMDDFFDKAKKFRTPLPGEGTRKWLDRLVAENAETAPQRNRILAGHAAAVQGLERDLGKRSVLEMLAQGDAGTLQTLARHGFALDTSDLDRLRTEAETALDAEQILALLRDEEMRAHIADRLGVEVRDVAPSHILKIGSSTRGARWLTDQVETTRQNAVAKIAALQESLGALTNLLKLSPDGIPAVCLAALADLKAGGEPSSVEARQLAGLIGHGVVRKNIGARVKLDPVLVKREQVYQVGSTPRGAVWLIEQMQMLRDQLPREIRDREQRLLEPLELPVERIVQVCQARLEQLALSEKLTRLEVAPEESWFGFSDRTAWLIIISFVVCVVGVTNAMLMSVTERFREIATMKCLGALDSFIMIIFVMESSLQGLAGGAIGIFLGLLLGMTRSLWGFGTLALANLPLLLLLGSAGVCIVVGVVLAAMAAVYPAWVAARLAPMEAMRIE